VLSNSSVIIHSNQHPTEEADSNGNVSGSYLGPDTDYPGRELLLFSFVLLDICYTALKWAMTPSFLVALNSFLSVSYSFNAVHLSIPC
jgi:hypothetical protein